MAEVNYTDEQLDELIKHLTAPQELLESSQEGFLFKSFPKDNPLIDKVANEEKLKALLVDQDKDIKLKSKDKKLIIEGKVVFTELQREWVRYRGLYRDYRAADNSKDRKNIMLKITRVKLKR